MDRISNTDIGGRHWSAVRGRPVQEPARNTGLRRRRPAAPKPTSLLSIAPALAQSRSVGEHPETIGILFWLGVILLIVFAVVGAGAALRRRYARSPGEDKAESFTLSDLRRLHASGDLTDEEYERAKALVIEQVRASGESPPDTEPPTPQPDKKNGDKSPED